MIYYTLKDIFKIDSQHPFYSWYNIWDGLTDTGQGFLPNLKVTIPAGDTADVQYLLDPLVNRWINDRIALYVSEDEVNFNRNYLREVAIAPILKKLNTIIPTYKELYKRYNEMITAINSGLSNEATTTSTSRHNDTPNANNDYSAETFTSDITSNTSTSKQTNNKLDDYDAIRARIENLPQQIINEMKVFEIWI